jgi:hypothetical protein
LTPGWASALDRGLRLLERDVEPDRASIVDDLVLRAQRLRPVAQDALVHPREVAEVDEVLDPPRCGAGPVVGVDGDRADAARTPPLARLRQGIGRFGPLPSAATRLQQDPRQADRLSGREALDPRAIRDRAAMDCGDAADDPTAIVRPAMVCADEARLADGRCAVGRWPVTGIDPAERQRGPTVDAEVGEGCDLASETDHDQALVEEGRRDRPVAHVVDTADGMPATPQRLMQERLARDIEVKVHDPVSGNARRRPPTASAPPGTVRRGRGPRCRRRPAPAAGRP